MFKRLLLILCCLCTACSTFPNIIILDDPLTAAEHLKLGIAYRGNGHTVDEELAVQEFQKVLKEEKTNLTALIHLGDIYYRRKEYKLAAGYFQKAYRYHPEKTLALNNLAWISLQEPDFSKAEKYIQEAISKDPEDLYIYLDTLLTIYYKSGEFDKAQTLLNKLESMAAWQDMGMQVLRNMADIKEKLQ